MPSGLRVDTDSWLQEYEQAKQAANDVLALIQVSTYPKNSTRRKEKSQSDFCPAYRTGTQNFQMEVQKPHESLQQPARSLERWARPWRTSEKHWRASLALMCEHLSRFAARICSRKACKLASSMQANDSWCLCSTENEKNRRRDMITSLKGRREQMLQSLRRDRNKSSR